MKALYFAACIAVSAICYSQENQLVLDQNNVSATISNRGTIFHDSGNNSSGYEVPKGSGNHLISAANFWFAGKDMNGILHASLGGFDSVYTDVFPGPFSSTNDYSNAENWKIWTMCQSEIDNFVNWFNSTLPGADTSLTFEEPTTEFMNRLATWPAHGNMAQGQDFNMFPYYDRFQDGFYDPTSGDYPIIKGCCATYMIQNDAGGLHTLSQTGPLNLEMHYMIYQYESDDYINDATFIDVMAINRGVVTYPEFAYGLTMDANIGNTMDDFMGSDSTNSMLYFYNGDNTDEGSYGENPPAMGIVSLKSNATSCTPTFAGNILTADGAWNMMNGLQNDGNLWLNPDLQPTNFVYSGNPNTPGEWSEINNANVPGDRRGIISHSNINLTPGDTILQSYAILYARSGNHLAAIQELKQQAADVKLFYADNTLMCSPYTAEIQEKQKLQFNVHPNPSEGLISIDFESKEKVSASILQADGKVIFIKELDKNEKTLDLSTLPKGLYFLQLSTEKESNIQKIILQ